MDKFVFLFTDASTSNRNLGPEEIAILEREARWFGANYEAHVAVSSNARYVMLGMSVVISNLNQTSKVRVLPCDPDLGQPKAVRRVRQIFCSSTELTPSIVDELKIYGTQVLSAMHSAAAQLREDEQCAAVFSHKGLVQLAIWASLGFPMNEQGPDLSPAYNGMGPATAVIFHRGDFQLTPIKVLKETEHQT